LTLGLRVNFHKINIGGIGIERNKIENYVMILNCSYMSIPFKCQSMPIGENLRKKYFSKGVVDKVKNKLSSLND